MVNFRCLGRALSRETRTHGLAHEWASTCRNLRDWSKPISAREKVRPLAKSARDDTARGRTGLGPVLLLQAATSFSILMPSVILADHGETASRSPPDVEHASGLGRAS